MTDPRDLLLSSYDYDLPPEQIAQAPVNPRHDAKLLTVPAFGSNLQSGLARVWDWPQWLHPNDLVVLNNTRVLKARLHVRHSNGSSVELLVLEPRGGGRWLCLGRPAKKLRPGDKLWLEAAGQPPLLVDVLWIDVTRGGRVIQFPTDYHDAASIEKLLDRYGEMPLPPYIQQSGFSTAGDYQTCYASRPGAVAAPTAGLHLSNELLAILNHRGIKIAYVTLHVGLGTFRPLETEDLRELQLHSEWVEVEADVVDAVNACHARGGRVIAVGTTSVRALEGAAAISGQLRPLRGPVDLVIKPGYRFSVIQGLLTNFHLPRSSLLLLVSALISRERLLDLYCQAVRYGLRFYSYGDAMWVLPEAVLPSARPWQD